MLPIIIHYFILTERVKIRILEFNETAMQITDYNSNIFVKWSAKKKVIVFSSGNVTYILVTLLKKKNKIIFFKLMELFHEHKLNWCRLCCSYFEHFIQIVADSLLIGI